MRFSFWSVGKTHDALFKAGIEAFTGRIKHYYPVEWKILPPAKSPDAATGRSRESEAALAALRPDDFLVLLDERGKPLTSPGLAQAVQQWANEGRRQVVFLIGGAYGVDDSLRQRANLVWSLSPLVFPHQLVRVILAEQVYRACTIQRNEKYHHS